MEATEAQLEPMIARFIALYNGVVARSLKETHPLAAGEVVDGIGNELVFAAVTQTGTRLPAISTAAPSLDALTNSVRHPAERSP